mmetsp:Transcript_865/g.1810  ORF Transcript_865/g.1810 Transcript_865/m.1810 type:complete len:382 (-) Transcript_865:167-1312(-)
MMSHLKLQRLISILLLLTTTFSIIAVEALYFSAGYENRLNHHRSSSILHLFGRIQKKKKKYYLNGNEDVASTRNQRIAEGGIIKRKIKKLESQRSKQSYRIERKKRSDRTEKSAKNQTTNPILFRWRGFRQKIRYLFFRNTVYVLQCENGKYYIGSTKNRKQRYHEHFENPRKGSKWTRKHKPIQVIAEYKRIPKRYLMGMESQMTAEYMLKFGVNNVRGSSYCLVRDYTTRDIPSLTGFLGHHNQLDYQDLYKELVKTLPRSDSPSLSVIPSTKNYFTETVGDYDDEENKNNYSDDYTNFNETKKAVRPQSSRSKRRNRRRKRDKRYKQSEVNQWISDHSNDDDTDRQSTFENRIEIPPRPPRATKRISTPIVDNSSFEN